MNNSDQANTNQLVQLFEQAQELKDEERDYDSAIDILSQIIIADPSFPTAYRTRGICFYSTAQHIEATQDLERAIEQDPKDHEALFWLGMSIEMLGAERNLAAAEHKGWRRTVSGSQYDYQTQLKAIEYLDKAIELEANYFYVYSRAIAHETVENYEKARQDYEDIMNRVDLEWPDYRHAALMGRARTYLGEGQEAKARQDLERYNQIEIENNRPYATVNIELMIREYRVFRQQSRPSS